MDDQQKKVEQLLKSGAGFDESRVEIAKFLFQEYGHSSSRLLTKAFRDEVQNPVPSMYTAAVAAAISGLPPNSGSPSSKESSLFARAKTIEDLSCPEEEFRLQVSVTRKSLKRIFDVVKTIVDSSFKYNDLLMIAWYLSSGESTLEEVAMVFELPGPDTVVERLTNTSRQLLGLRKNAKMDLPIIEFEEDDIADSFERRTGLPQVLGALGVFKLECADGTYLCALSVCDHRHYFRHLSLYTDLDTTSDIVRTSPIFERLSEDHPKGYTYFCPAEGYPFLPQLTPNIQPDELDLFEKSSAREFSLRHNKVVNHLRTSIREVTSRFPKLNHLETACPDIVEAAFLLHNLCIDTRDTSVNFDDPDAVPPPSSLF